MPAEVDASDAPPGNPVIIAPPPAPGFAGFAFSINGAVQTPMTCPNADWEFPLTFDCVPGDPCPGVTSVLLTNTGNVPFYVTAADDWPNAGSYLPGVPTGVPNQIAEEIAPGAGQYLDSLFGVGLIVLLGSSEPFSLPGEQSDQGAIPWPANVAGSNGSAQMWLAEIELTKACQTVNKVW